jgi:hypothetical protein
MDAGINQNSNLIKVIGTGALFTKILPDNLSVINQSHRKW